MSTQKRQNLLIASFWILQATANFFISSYRQAYQLLHPVYTENDGTVCKIHVCEDISDVVPSRDLPIDS